MSDRLFTFNKGRTPLLINVPHAGTYIPPDIRDTLTPIAQTTPDTDWHVGLLYEFAVELGAGLMVATHSRYVVDLNRDPHHAALYPGADNTELCPLRSFDNDPLYREGLAPTSAEVESRRQRYWSPYQAELRHQLDAIRSDHGLAILLDGHSIRTQVPRFFAGDLPALNLGTADGLSCDPRLEQAAMGALAAQSGFSNVLNGRFKGGYITRHYGQPQHQIHALQLEMTQRSYMVEGPPYAWDPLRAEPLIEVLRALIAALMAEL